MNAAVTQYRTLSRPVSEIATKIKIFTNVLYLYQNPACIQYFSLTLMRYMVLNQHVKQRALSQFHMELVVWRKLYFRVGSWLPGSKMQALFLTNLELKVSNAHISITHQAPLKWQQVSAFFHTNKFCRLHHVLSSELIHKIYYAITTSKECLFSMTLDSAEVGSCSLVLKLDFNVKDETHFILAVSVSL